VKQREEIKSVINEFIEEIRIYKTKNLTKLDKDIYVKGEKFEIKGDHGNLTEKEKEKRNRFEILLYVKSRVQTVESSKQIRCHTPYEWADPNKIMRL
jgi:hypothetical protein